MARGKHTCRILKDIRRQIAEANGIEFAVSECQYKGDCAGTCPKCEAELRYLEQQLRLRRMMGKAVVIAGISTGIAGLSGCSDRVTITTSDSNAQSPVEDIKKDSSDERCMLFIDSPVDSSDPIVLDGEIPRSDRERINREREMDTIPDPMRIYTVTDVKPEFPGGLEGLIKFIRKHVRYTEEIRKEKGKRVWVEFVIDADGHVRTPYVSLSKGKAKDAEALRVVGLLPDFKPGLIKGQPVRTLYTVPVLFDGEEENK